MTHYYRDIFESAASQPAPATSTTVVPMALDRPPRPPLLAVLDAVLRHPGAALVVSVALWLLDHLLRS